MTYAPNPEPGAAETQALHTATDIMAILHDAVLNPGPGGLTQVKAQIQIAVRDAIKSMVPDVPQSVTVSAAGNLRVGQDDLVLANASLAQQNASLAKQNGDLAERNNALLAEHDRLAVENTQLQGKLHDLQHDGVIADRLERRNKAHEARTKEIRDALGIDACWTDEQIVEAIEALRAKNGELAREASNYRQEAAANAQRRDEARAERDDLQAKLQGALRQRELAVALEDTILKIQDALGILNPSEDSPVVDDRVILDAIDCAKRRISAEHQKALRNLVAQWMPPAGVGVFNVWLNNQPREA